MILTHLAYLNARGIFIIAIDVSSYWDNGGSR